MDESNLDETVYHCGADGLLYVRTYDSSHHFCQGWSWTWLAAFDGLGCQIHYRFVGSHMESIDELLASCEVHEMVEPRNAFLTWTFIHNFITKKRARFMKHLPVRLLNPLWYVIFDYVDDFHAKTVAESSLPYDYRRRQKTST